MRCFYCKGDADGTIVDTYHDGTALDAAPCCSVCGAAEEGEHPGTDNGYGVRMTYFIPGTVYRNVNELHAARRRELDEEIAHSCVETSMYQGCHILVMSSDTRVANSFVAYIREIPEDEGGYIEGAASLEAAFEAAREIIERK